MSCKQAGQFSNFYHYISRRPLNQAICVLFKSSVCKQVPSTFSHPRPSYTANKRQGSSSTQIKSAVSLWTTTLLLHRAGFHNYHRRQYQVILLIDVKRYSSCSKDNKNINMERDPASNQLVDYQKEFKVLFDQSSLVTENKKKYTQTV